MTDHDAELQELRALLEPRLDAWRQEALDADLPEWGDACRQLRQALAGPVSIYKSTLLGMLVGWHSRDQDVRRLGNYLLAWRREPKERGHRKEGATKVDPFEVRDYYEGLLAQRQSKAAAKAATIREYGVSRSTFERYLKKTRNMKQDLQL